MRSESWIRILALSAVAAVLVTAADLIRSALRDDPYAGYDDRWH